MIGLASDHAGYPLKEYVKTYLDSRGIDWKDYGTFSEESCDYPDFGHALAKGIEAGECEKGIAVCGSDIQILRCSLHLGQTGGRNHGTVCMERKKDRQKNRR